MKKIDFGIGAKVSEETEKALKAIDACIADAKRNGNTIITFPPEMLPEAEDPETAIVVVFPDGIPFQ